MSLLRRIQDAMTDPKCQLADILRMCKILASRLKHQAFKEWIEQELNGYKGIEQLPSYRILRGLGCRGNFFDPTGQLLKNVQFPLRNLPEEIRTDISTIYFLHGVSALENDIKLANQENQINLRRLLNADCLAFLGSEGWVCGGAWTDVPTAAYVATIDTIKNRILDFVIEIEAENPNAGDALPHEKLIPDQIVNNIYCKFILHEQMTENYTNNLQGATVANMANTVKDNARQQANQYIHLSEEKRTLAEAANEIQQLIQQLEKTNPTATEAEAIAHINDETKPSFKRRASIALQSLGETAIDEFVLENKYLKVVKAAIKGWVKPN
jgi:hypothetical protein